MKFIYRSTLPKKVSGMDVWAGYEQGRRSRRAAAARINIKKNGAAAVKNDVGPATVGREGIGGALMSPKARTKMANTVHAEFSNTFDFSDQKQTKIHRSDQP